MEEQLDDLKNRLRNRPEQGPHVQVADDDDVPPPQREIPRPHPPAARAVPPAMPVNRPQRSSQVGPNPVPRHGHPQPSFASQHPDPVPDDSDKGAWAISRELLREKYGMFFGAIGLICSGNSFYTTFVGVVFIWEIAFGSGGIGKYAAAVITIILLFAGQVWNADYDNPVIVDEDGDEALDLKQIDKNKKRAYFFWLTPDANFTLYFWIVPFFRILTFIFFGRSAPAESVRDIAMLWPTAFAHSRITGIVFSLCLITAVALASAWGVASAYFPEKALLGPRTRERIRAAIRKKAEQLHQ